MLPKLLFLSFLVGSLTSSSRTISKSFLLLRIDFVDDDDDDEEEEEDKPSSSESSEFAKKTRSSGQRERGARVKGVARTTPAKAFDATQAHVNVLKMYMSFLNFFPSALPWLKFRVYNPNSSR